MSAHISRSAAARLALMASCAAAALAPSTAAAQDQLRVYTWSDYIGETTLEDFTAATGIEVVYDVYDSNETLEAQVLSGRASYDVIMPTAQPFFARMVAAGLVQPLDMDQVPNFTNQDPGLLERVALADPTMTHGAIYQWGTNGFGYNEEAILSRMPNAPVGSWDLILDPDVVSNFADCGVTFLDSPSEVFPVVLHYLGHDPQSSDPQDLVEAVNHMAQIFPYITQFNSSEYINDLATGETCLAMGFSGDILQAADRAAEAEDGPTINYVIPEEGTIVWFDIMTIPADAPNPDVANRFINFLLQPEVMAGITNYVAYANAVPASLEFVDEEIANDPGIFPTEDVAARLFSVGSVTPEYERIRSNAWQRVRSGQ